MGDASMLMLQAGRRDARVGPRVRACPAAPSSTRALVAALLAAALAPVAAADVVADVVSTDPAATRLPRWEAGIGLAALRVPHYRGAGQSRNLLLPLPYLVYRGEIVKADRDGARADLLRGAHWRIDLSLAAGAPASSSSDRARRGMPDLEPTVEFGPSLNVRLGRGTVGDAGGRMLDWTLDARLPVRGVVALSRRPRVIGAVSQPNLLLGLRHGPWNAALQAGPLVATRALNGYYQDVTPDQARPGRTAYRASGGRAGWQAMATLSRRVGDVWVGAFVRWDDVADAVYADGPLVRRHGTVGYGIALAWVAARSDERVDVAP